MEIQGIQYALFSVVDWICKLKKAKVKLLIEERKNEGLWDVGVVPCLGWEYSYSSKSPVTVQ